MGLDRPEQLTDGLQREAFREALSFGKTNHLSFWSRTIRTTPNGLVELKQQMLRTIGTSPETYNHCTPADRQTIQFPLDTKWPYVSMPTKFPKPAYPQRTGSNVKWSTRSNQEQEPTSRPAGAQALKLPSYKLCPHSLTNIHNIPNQVCKNQEIVDFQEIPQMVTFWTKIQWITTTKCIPRSNADKQLRVIITVTNWLFMQISIKFMQICDFTDGGHILKTIWRMLDKSRKTRKTSADSKNTTKQWTMLNWKIWTHLHSVIVIK